LFEPVADRAIPMQTWEQDCNANVGFDLTVLKDILPSAADWYIKHQRSPVPNHAARNPGRGTVPATTWSV